MVAYYHQAPGLFVTRAAKELYDPETEDVKNEIKAILDAAVKDKEEAEVDSAEQTPQQYLK